MLVVVVFNGGLVVQVCSNLNLNPETLSSKPPKPEAAGFTGAGGLCQVCPGFTVFGEPCKDRKLRCFALDAEARTGM